MKFVKTTSTGFIFMLSFSALFYCVSVFPSSAHAGFLDTNMTGLIKASTDSWSTYNKSALKTARATLVPTGNCSALKAAAIEAMETQLDENLALVLENSLFCITPIFGGGGFFSAAEDSPVDGAQEYSETNTQVVGVDEADFVKNDGSYIYILADGKFQIIDAWPPESAQKISSFDIEGDPKKLFIRNQRAFIYSSLDYAEQENDDYFPPGYSFWGYSTECTYGYNCDFTGDGRETKITILDISDVTEPTLLREIFFSGSYINSRRVGDAVHSVLLFPAKIDGLLYWPEELDCSNYDKYTDEELESMFEALKADNRAIIESINLTEFLPSVKDIRYENNQVLQTTEGILGTCNDYHTSTQEDAESFISIVSMNINGSGDLKATTIVGSPGAVYSSSSALYIASRQTQTWDIYWSFYWNTEESTLIHKFNLNNDTFSSSYAASGVINGRVLYQFSMDEHEGFFRIAATSGHVPGSNVHSTVSILEENNGTLQVVGSINDIAPTEDIRAARFFGDRGYIVTFKKTDPLFALDLSNPYNPKIAGELKIPGYSTYIHYIDDDHLLTIGYDADDQGSFGWFQGIMLQIFDVSDMTNPLLAHKEVIGTRGTTSDAATNHLAFNYFQPSGKNYGLLAIPMNICEGSSGGGDYGDTMTFSGLMVYEVAPETGFEFLGGISHSAPENPYVYSSACYNWWTDSNSYVKRSIFMDDYVFSITQDTIKANLIYELGEDIAEINLTTSASCGPDNIALCDTEIACIDAGGVWSNGACMIDLYFANLSKGPFTDSSCIAHYDASTKILNIPCASAGGKFYDVSLLFTYESAIRFKLVDIRESPDVDKADWHPCNTPYWAASELLFIPYLDMGATAVSSLRLKHVQGAPGQPWTVEFVGFKEFFTN